MIFTRDGSGCRAGLVVRDRAAQHYLLTCGHAFQTDQPFATRPIGETIDGHGRRVLFARLRANFSFNAIDAALVEVDPVAPAGPLRASLSAKLQLNQHKLTILQRQAPVQLAAYGFPAMVLADGPPCHRGESGSLATNTKGQPAAIVIGMFQNQIVLCDLPSIFAWFHQNGIAALRPVAFATSQA
jgi:hypothetical protein